MYLVYLSIRGYEDFSTLFIGLFHTKEAAEAMETKLNHQDLEELDIVKEEVDRVFDYPHIVDVYVECQKVEVYD